jgi:D-alanyl-D-alanine dipeptidase
MSTPPAHSRLALGSLLAAAPLIALAHTVVPASDAAQAGMTNLAIVAPAIEIQMRYLGSDNFTGAPVPGYEANICYLKHDAAQALARVQARLHAAGYQLQVFDCYRPAQAVTSFVKWAHQPADAQARARYFPRVEKPALLNGYISATSGHSRGYTVDLSLRDCRNGTCRELDMGTPFDFFDASAHTDAEGLPAQVRDNRRQLVQAMAAEGFANYPMEWWHFTLKVEPTPTEAYDFPVR